MKENKLNEEELKNEFIKIMQNKLIVNSKYYNLSLVDKVLTNKELNIVLHFLKVHKVYKVLRSSKNYKE